jgi:hypothetical protein
MKRLAMSIAAGGLLFVAPVFGAGTAFAASTSMTHTATHKAATHKATTHKTTKATKTMAAKPAVHKTVVHRTVVAHRTVFIPGAAVVVHAAVGLLLPLIVTALIGLTIIL